MELSTQFCLKEKQKPPGPSLLHTVPIGRYPMVSNDIRCMSSVIRVEVCFFLGNSMLQFKVFCDASLQAGFFITCDQSFESAEGPSSCGTRGFVKRRVSQLVFRHKNLSA